MIKQEQNFDKYMTIWGKRNSQLIHNKKYLKDEKRFNIKESFQCFYISVILFDSGFRKNGNYCPKVFLEKFIYSFFWRNIKNFSFWSFGSSSWSKKENFGGVSVSWNIKNFHFPKYKESFLFKNIRNFLILEQFFF